MNRRRMFQTLALAPVGVLLSQESEPVSTPETIAATQFIQVADRTRQLLKGSDDVRIRDSRVESAQAFATMALFLSPEIKRQMEQNIRSYDCWWAGVDSEGITKVYRKYGVELEEVIIPDGSRRDSAIEFLDYAGIDGFLDGFPQLIHPDQFRFVPKPRVRMSANKTRNASVQSLAACGGGNYEDGFFAAAGLIASSLGLAAFGGCIPCGPVAVGIGFALSMLKAARTVSCMGSGEKK